MKVLISGGGTGGHIYPGLAVARNLKLEGAEITFVGTEEGLESQIIPQSGYQLKTINVEGLPRKISLRLFKAILKSGIGLLEAWKIINEFKPDIVVGTGGYVCGPVVLAAALNGLPTLIHEQNAYPGLTNKLLARFVDKIALSDISAKDYFSNPEKIVLTGNPVRPEILSKGESEAYRELGFDSNKKVILVFGGSRGARSINQVLIGMYRKFLDSNLQLLHITGKTDFEAVKRESEEAGIDNLQRGNIIIKPYEHNMEAALAVADIVIARAGATGLAEITALGIPAILIPYPYAAEDHQEYNARSLEENGAARVILDHNLTTDTLFEVLTELVGDEQQLKKMARASKKLGRPDAVKNLVSLIKELGN